VKKKLRAEHIVREKMEHVYSKNKIDFEEKWFVRIEGNSYMAGSLAEKGFSQYLYFGKWRSPCRSAALGTAPVLVAVSVAPS